MDLSIVLPAYNEMESISELTDRFYKVLKTLKLSFEIVYVIQGNDGSFELLKKMKDSGRKELKILYFPTPIGVGRAFKVGFFHINPKTKYVLTMDADLNHPPEYLPDFLKAIETTHADIVIGSRRIKGGRIDKEADAMYSNWKKAISWFTNIFLVLLNLKVKDITSGYRLFKSHVIFDIRDKIRSRNFEVYAEILFLAKKFGCQFKEIPITFKARIYGKSKLNFFTSGLGYVKLMVRVFLSRR